MTSRTAALLATELLAGARHVAAFAGGASQDHWRFSSSPADDTVEDVGTRVDAEHIVVKIDVRASLAVDGERR